MDLPDSTMSVPFNANASITKVQGISIEECIISEVDEKICPQVGVLL